MKTIKMMAYYLFFISIFFLYDLSHASGGKEPKEKKVFSVDFVTNGDLSCHQQEKELKCNIWYEKKRFILGVNVDTELDLQTTAIDVGLNVIFSGGLIIPIYMIFPKKHVSYSSYAGNSTSIIEVQLLEKIPGVGEEVSVVLNAVKIQTVQSNENGNFTIDLSGEGVYELTTESKKYGIMVIKEIYIE